MGRVSCNAFSINMLSRETSFVPCGACELQSKEKFYKFKKFSFVPCGACELQSEEENEAMRKYVSSPVGRVSCNLGLMPVSVGYFSFVPCGACELQSKTEVLKLVDFRVSSPVGRVSCNFEKVYRMMLEIYGFVPCGACELQYEYSMNYLKEIEFRPLWGV